MELSFYRPRPSGGPLASIERLSLGMATEALTVEAAVPAHFEPIPFPPTGPFPYQLDLAEIFWAQKRWIESVLPAAWFFIPLVIPAV